MSGADPPGESRILIIGREPIGRLGLETLVEKARMAVVGSVATAAEAVDLLGSSPPTAMILARLVGRAAVLSDLKALRQAAPATPIVVLSSNGSTKEIASAIEAGAASWLNARAATTEIAAALRAVAWGLVVVSRSSAKALADPAASQAPPRRPATPALAAVTDSRRLSRAGVSERERDVLRLLANGQRNDQIAEAMGLSAETVRRAVQSLTQKLAGDVRGEIA